MGRDAELNIVQIKWWIFLGIESTYNLRSNYDLDTVIYIDDRYNWWVWIELSCVMLVTKYWWYDIKNEL